MARKTISAEWANAAAPSEIVAPTTTKQNNGWTAEKPPYQNFNWAWQIFTNMLQNAEQNGIMEWSTDTTYPQYGLALGSDGKAYQSQIASNQGNDPTVDGGTNWLVWQNVPQNIMVYSGATVYSGVIPSTFTDLDLSGTVGANRASVRIRIEPAGDTGSIRFRTNGDTKSPPSQIADTRVADCNSGTEAAELTVITDSSGIVEWDVVGPAPNAIVKVLTYHAL